MDTAEKKNDREEQVRLSRFVNSAVPMPVHSTMPDLEQDLDDFEDLDQDQDFDMDGDVDFNDLDEDDGEDDGEDLGDGDEELEDNANPALAATTLGTLRRVVHTNGIHHIGMVSCQCHGKEILPLDLSATQLLPASLKNIKTIFTTQVLDQFRLCNLELKASAYQYYQLLRRLTKPMAPDEVINLYREFRRMTRIWRWMKRLKWAGYAGSSKKVKDVEAGELAIFCPACPQQGINIPDNWREDSARQVRQRNEIDDVWLSEGSGMIPKRNEYFSFLATAIERLTVSAMLFYMFTRHLVASTTSLSRYPARICRVRLKLPVPECHSKRVAHFRCYFLALYSLTAIIY